MEVMTGTEARKNFFKLPEHVEYGNEVYVKMKNKKDLVILSAKEWGSIKETLYLKSIPGMWESIEKASKEPLSKATRLEDLDW